MDAVLQGHLRSPTIKNRLLDQSKADHFKTSHLISSQNGLAESLGMNGNYMALSPGMSSAFCLQMVQYAECIGLDSHNPEVFGSLCYISSFIHVKKAKRSSLPEIPCK
jgi:hypothetical protein